jgi:hypothetical protein
MPLSPFDPAQEATALTNELFYRAGAYPKSLHPPDAMLVRDTIERGLREAFEAGKKSAVAS